LSTIVGGERNLAQGVLSFIGGGECNNICNTTSGCLALGAVVVGGVGNNTCGGTWDLATCQFTVAPLICSAGQYSFVGGGFQNVATNIYNVVVGGICNRACASATEAFIGSGLCNIVNGTSSAIVSGRVNNITGSRSFIGSGSLNVLSGNWSTISGGYGNTVSACCSTISGGFNNIVSSDFSAIVGGRSNLTQGVLSFVGAGFCNNVCNSTSGCLALGSVVVGGVGNNTTGGTWDLPTCSFTVAPTICNAGQYSFVGGGFQNRAGGLSNADWTTVVGGCCNSSTGFFDFVGGGACNRASGWLSLVGGGICNTVSQIRSGIVGGDSNIVSGINSFIVGGTCNTVSGSTSIIGAGRDNIVSANNSSLLGGAFNCVTSCESIIGGGLSNVVNGFGTSILGGRQNQSQANLGFIGGGQFNRLCNSTSGCLAIGSVVVGGVGNNTTGGTWDITTCTFTVAPTICNAGQYSFVGGGFQNRVQNNFGVVVGGCCNVTSSNYSAILGGKANNTSTFCDTFIIGSNLTASQACTTFVNCLSAANISAGQAVCATTNNVLVGYVPNLFSQTGTSTNITATTAETSLIDGGVGTLTVPANAFSIGDSFTAVMSGLISAANGETLRVRVKAGSIILLDSGVISLSAISNDVYTLDIAFTIRQIGAATTATLASIGTFTYHKSSNGNVEGFSFSTINNTTFDTTISNTLDITAQWGSNNATNSIFSEIFTLNKTY
jgi:hypothetical protein